MTLKVKCDCCSDEMTEFGALYFGVPSKDGRTIKKHICKKCASRFEALFT